MHDLLPLKNANRKLRPIKKLSILIVNILSVWNNLGVKKHAIIMQIDETIDESEKYP
tara:strand:+ start:475 stop:645 length:171 start_codon:yes stop_codon:yes gene_type:complete